MRQIAEVLLTTLTEKTLVRLRAEKSLVIQKIAAVLRENFLQEETLEKEAKRLAEEHLRRIGDEVDRYKVIQLIKQRLAEERRFVL